MHKFFFYNKFIIFLYMSRALCTHHQEVKIVLYSIWYHTCRWPSPAQIGRRLSQSVQGTATYMCDDTRDCIIQFCPPDDEHLCSKHVETWNKLIIKFSASSWLILRLIYCDARSAKYIKNVEFYSKNKFEKSVNIVGFVIRIYHDARSPERQMMQCTGNICNVAEGCNYRQ